MEFNLLHILTLLSVVLVASHAALPSEDYWKSVLPNTPMPKAVTDLLHSSEWVEDKGTAVNVGKGGVNVNTGKGKGGGTKVNVGGKGVGVNTGKPGKGTNVGVGKGGVSVSTGHKGKPVYVGVKPGPSPFNYLYAATEDQLHDNPNVALFFLEKDLQQAKSMNLHFTKSSTPADFLPRKVANSIPFSSEKLPQIFSQFSVNPNTMEAEIIKKTISECEEPGIEGEEKYCATSLESMIDFSTSKLGKKVEAISTDVEKETGMQSYRFVGVKKMNAEKSVVCHKQNYAYAVFYCHKTDTVRAYSVSLVGSDGTKAKAVAVCHTDTSKWNPKHLAQKHEGMARNLGFLILVLSITSICEAATICNPISDSHRSAAVELFETSNGSLEEIYEALKTSEVLGIERNPDTKASACKSVADTLRSPTSNLQDLFYALRVNGQLKCELNDEAFGGIASRIKDSVKEVNSLLDFYYSVGSLILIKGQTSEVEVLLGDADGIFRSIKALSQSDGRWRYSSNNPESSTYAAGIALETLAGVVSLASSEIDQYLIGTVKNDVVKLFDSIEKYDDGAYYFDEKLHDASGNQGPLSATSSVVRGLTAFATASSANLNLPGDKILGLAKFFLSIGVPGNAKDLYYQIDALACLESNRVSIPLILSLPSTVLSLTRKDVLKVRVNTVLGSTAPPLSVKLMQVFSSGSKDASIIDQELTFNPENDVHILNALPESVDIGNYVFVLEIVLHDPDHKKTYATGGRTKVAIFVTGVVKVDNAKIAVLDSDLGSVETQKKLNLAGENSVSLSANHLQKLHLSFQLSTPLGHAFNPHQAFLRLTHETKVEHIFIVGSSGKQFTVVLDFLGLVEKFFYLSGRYDIQLTVGDAVMENSFLQNLGHVELDLPEPPEKATRPPPQAVDPYLRYGPKAEITHIFRAPEKRPPQELSLAFLVLILLPFIGFLVGLLRLGANLKNFPTSTVPATFAILFHVGIGAVLSLYVLFWLKLDLFTTLKALGFLGIFLMFVGHRTLSHLASTSAKLKHA